MFICLSLAIGLVSCVKAPRVTDSVLRSVFAQHRDDFIETVRLMKSTRGIVGFECKSVRLPNRTVITRERAISEGYLSKAEARELCALMKRLRISLEIGISMDHSTVSFPYEVTGLVTGGRKVSIVYSEVSLAPCRESIDDHREETYVSSRLEEPDWYLERLIW
jgi:hypothetical protein